MIDTNVFFFFFSHQNKHECKHFFFQLTHLNNSEAKCPPF